MMRFVLVLLALGLFGACFAQNCQLLIPPNPLTAVGLSTPFLLRGCDQANFSNEGSFVQGAVLDILTGQISIYNPLVITEGTQPFAAPVVPTITATSIVALWFGTNAAVLELVDDGSGALAQGNCVNGINDGQFTSLFGQFSYCNAPSFFQFANLAIQAGQLMVPPLGTALDGATCPSIRDYFVVDQDQSDNVDTIYLFDPNTRTFAQNTAANRALLTTAIVNPSDNGLLPLIDAALGCTPFKAPDLADNGNLVPALPLNELSAAANQAAPYALVPALDPMVLQNGAPFLEKVNLYRIGVNQPTAATIGDADTTVYCTNLFKIMPPRLQVNQARLAAATSPAPAVGDSLFTFLAARFVTATQILNCTQLTGLQNPLSVNTDGNGVATSVNFNIAQPPNMDCALIVPADPLGTGLKNGSPYILRAADPNAGPCHMANPNQVSFVQGAIVDTDTGALYVYNPLVIDQGTTPAIAPVAPTLPTNYAAAVWFGSNANTITLIDDGSGSLTKGNCVNGLTGSIFGQFAYCNAPDFFSAVNGLITAGKITVPPLGVANDGLPCPTIRDFFVVDMDQSDNVLTKYLVTSTGTTAQSTQANKAALPGATDETNGSDNRLLDKFIDPALGCHPWQVPDLADPGKMVPALPLNEIQAAALQAAPIALVPAGDPMTLDANGNQNMDKVNLYRAGVNQPQITTLADASTASYCQFMGSVFPFRLFMNQAALSNFTSPDPAAATNLYNFLAMRFVTAFGAGGLDCTDILGVDVMVSVVMNHDAIVVNASIDAGDLLMAEFGGSSSPKGVTNTTAIIISVVVIGQVIILVIIGAAVARYCRRKNEARANREEELESYGGRRINANDDRGLMNNNYDHRTGGSDRSSPYGTPRRQDFYGNASPHGSNPLFNNSGNNGYGNDRGYDNGNNGNGYGNGNNGYANNGNGNGYGNDRGYNY